MKLSIQSKLMLMLLGVCISSIVAIAYIGYSSGQEILRNSIFNQLTSLRESKAYQIETYYQNVRGQIRTISEFQTVVEAMKSLKTAYLELETESLPVAWNNKLKDYYNRSFLPVLNTNIPIEGERSLFAYFPRNTAARYLQYNYIANNPNNIDKRSSLNFANDGSQYSKLHQKYNPIFRKFISTFDYGDLMLIDIDTKNIIYTVDKEVDFATNLDDGPYANSSLARLVEEISQVRDSDLVITTDFESYSGAYGKPSSFMGSLIFDNGEPIGVLVIQLSTREINQIMTGGQHWEKNGLGKTGETYLVGEDGTMRTISRFLVEEPEEYFQAIEANGTPPEKIEQIKNLETSITLQEVNTSAVEKALTKETGVDFVTDYRGVTVLSAYRPLSIANLNWIVLAEIDRQEAFAPIRAFQIEVLLSTVILVLLVTLVASLLSYYFLRPIRKLIEGFRQVGKGRTDVRVKIQSHDELRELANSFNEMVDNLDRQQELVKQKNQENEELLQSILPEPVAKRLKGGEASIADSFPNVTVLFAEAIGFTELSHHLSASETVAYLNELVSAFDEAAERYGVEKVKTIGSGYMAVSGLTVPRIDHTKRVVDFALEMVRILQRFNREHQTELKLRIGVNSGEVVAGIVGRSKFIYDLFGDTVNIAHNLQIRANSNRVYVTDSIHSRLAEVYDFEAPQELEIAGKGKILAWAVGV